MYRHHQATLLLIRNGCVKTAGIGSWIVHLFSKYKLKVCACPGFDPADVSSLGQGHAPGVQYLF